MRPVNENDAFNLIFGGGLEVEEELSDIEDEIEELDATQRKEKSERPSTYVRVMEDMINEVDSYESHLLSEDEWSLIRLSGNEMKYHARYLLARLLCRKQNRWHSFNALHRYTSEIGEDGIRQAITDLAAALEPSEEAKVRVEESEIIDLTLDEEEEDRKPVAGPSRLATPHTQSKDAVFEHVMEDFDLSYFCKDESTMTLREILETLPADQVRALAKEAKVSPNGTKKENFVNALMKYSSTQASLPFQSPKKNKSRQTERYGDGYRQTVLCFAVPCKETQEQRLKEMALNRLGRCVRLNYDFYRLVRRFSIIFYRSVHLPTDIFLPSLLSEFKKRIYPKYNATRTGQIWDSREAFLQYEEALYFEAELEAILENEEKELRASMSPKRGTANLGKTPRPVKADDDETVDDVDDEDWLSPQQMVAKAVREKVMNTILPRWRLCVAVKRAVKKEVHGEDPRPGLDRFEPGYIYTRMVEKYARALGQLKEYEAEVETLDELLGQRFWRRGKRGSWYDRRALVEITYLSKVEGKKSKSRPKLKIAMEHLKDALRDEDTHLICRPGLFRRLQKVEKTLRVPEEQRSQCEGDLKRPEEVIVHAERVKRSNNSLQLDQFGRPKGKENGAPGSSKTKDGGKIPSWIGKSLWRGERNEEVNVETRTLQAYAEQGYKGFHSETRILTTIFGLLFWDIIFADIPGAFETKFQTAPLDIAEDSFYYARKELIQVRLREIEDGRATEILERHDRTYRPSKTWCVGVKWEYPKDDLLEIVQCFKGESLATICHLFCEDYGGRSSGAPDLIVWKPEDRECKFVEVKGPGDRLQENQKLWCDALQRAEVEVQLCHVVDVYGKAKRINKKRKKLEEESFSGPEDDEDENIDEEAEYQPPPPPRKRPAGEDAEEEEEHFPLAMSQPRTTPTEWPTAKVEVVITSPSPVKKRRKLDVVSAGS
ncbi:VRR-NUC domain-containing protein [Armillaria novae-zelandiae]|uniref:Fanconi-associated nuclease n=1 Tax=Armillaria novae-zelandiae TaxID=153914 RepID=A0AA39PEA5_9AGAR|nr:VRR-NUC domain-containing protein [Armillaria novae-zelandiae]